MAIPIVCWAVSVSVMSLGIVPATLSIGAWVWPVSTVFVTLPAFLAIIFVLLKQLAADRREKQRLAHEVEAARVVQQLMLSRCVHEPGEYRIEAEYRPALEVGGDFYYTHHEASDAMVVMLGDVSGKGLTAAMRVAVIFGLLRDREECQPRE